MEWKSVNQDAFINMTEQWRRSAIVQIRQVVTKNKTSLATAFNASG